jgi:hypothetical protein
MRVSSRKKKKRDSFNDYRRAIPSWDGPSSVCSPPLFFLLVLPTWSLDLGSWVLGLVSRGLNFRLHVVISFFPFPLVPPSPPPHCFSHCDSPPHLVASHDLPQPPRASRTCIKSSELLDSHLRSYLRTSNPYPDHRVLPRNQIARSQSSPVDRYRVPKVPRVGRPRVRLLPLQPPAPCSLFTIYYFRSLPHCGVRRPPYH